MSTRFPEFISGSSLSLLVEAARRAAWTEQKLREAVTKAREISRMAIVLHERNSLQIWSAVTRRDFVRRSRSFADLYKKRPCPTDDEKAQSGPISVPASRTGGRSRAITVPSRGHAVGVRGGNRHALAASQSCPSSGPIGLGTKICKKRNRFLQTDGRVGSGSCQLPRLNITPVHRKLPARWVLCLMAGKRAEVCRRHRHLSWLSTRRRWEPERGRNGPRHTGYCAARLLPRPYGR